MDVRLQIHRMTHWLGKFVAILLLALFATLNPAQAAVESVVPLSGGIIAWSLNGWWWTGITFSSADATCRSVIQDPHMIGNGWLWDSALNYSYMGTVPIRKGYGTLGSMDCMYVHIPDGVVIPAGLAGSALPMHNAVCPIPTINPVVPYSYNAATNMCERDVVDILILTLSGGNEVEPSNGSSTKTLPFIATVKDQSTGQPPTSPVKVHISLKVDSKSGGHAHGTSDRPRGGIADVQTCTSDAECWSNSTVNGAVVFNFNAPEASGKYTITATCDGCTNNPQMATVNVKVDGLEQIPDAPSFYTFIGATTEHNDNHYLTPEAASILLYMASSYHVEDKFWQLQKARKGKGLYTYTPAPLFHLNDSSLVWGGLFDRDGDWEAPHEEHRRGTVIDIRANLNTGAIPTQNFDNFIELAAFYGADAGLHSANDLSNRHFHVRLLNRKE